jgi:hypothetical protein
MSKRYGRQQKHDHRKRIAELEGEVAFLRTMLAFEKKQRGRVEGELADVCDEIRRVSPFSALLPPAKMPHPMYQLRAFRQKTMRQRVLDAVGPGGDFLIDEREEEVALDTITLDLHAVKATLDEHRATHERLAHVLFRVGEHAVGYSVSELAMRELFNLGNAERVVFEQIRRALAPYLERLARGGSASFRQLPRPTEWSDPIGATGEGL